MVDGYFARHKVKPGITGWAQINGWRGETDTPEKIQKRVEHDLYYIENWSLLLDLYILFKTPFALLAQRKRVLRRGARMTTLALAPPQAPPASSRSAAHRLALALVWLTVASGAVVFTEPAPIEVLTMGLVVLLPRSASSPSRGRFSALLALMLVAAAAAVLAATNATDLAVAMTHTGVSLYMYLATFVFAAFVAKRPEAHTRLILNAYVWAAAAAAVLGIVGYFNLFPGAHELMTRYGRATGLFKDPNVFGPFLVPALVYGLSRLTGASLRKSIPLLVLLLVIGLAMLLSFSRGAWFNLGVAIGDLRRAAHPHRSRQPRAAQVCRAGDDGDRGHSPCWSWLLCNSTRSRASPPSGPRSTSATTRAPKAGSAASRRRSG